MLEKFNIKYSKSVSTSFVRHFRLSKKSCPSTKKENDEMLVISYSSAIGNLMCAMVCTRLDISHTVGVVSRFLANPGKTHWEAVKWIFRYLTETSKVCLSFGESKPFLKGYTNSDMARDLDSRKSTSKYLFTFAREAISCKIKVIKVCFIIYYRGRIHTNY